MVSTIQRTVASGNTDTFTIPFPYLDKSHVVISLNGIVLSSDAYTWPSAGSVQITAGNPSPGTIVERRRVTPADILAVFEPGNLDTEDLNVAVVQPLFIAQEGADLAQDIAARAWLAVSNGVGGTVVPGSNSTVPMWQDGNLVTGPSAAEIENAEENAETAQTAATTATEQADRAEGYANSLNVPLIEGHGGEILGGKEDESGMEYLSLNYVRGNVKVTPFDAALGSDRVAFSDIRDPDADWTTNINAWFELGRDSWSVTRQAFDAFLDGGGYQYRCEGEVGLVGLKQPGLTLRDFDLYSLSPGIMLNFGDTNHMRFLGRNGVYADPDTAGKIAVLTGAVDSGSGFRASPGFKNAGILEIRGKPFVGICNFGGEVFEIGKHYLSTTSRSPLSVLYATIASGQAFEDYFPGLTSSLCTLPNGTNHGTGTATTLRSDIIHRLGLIHMAHQADFNLAITGIDLPSGDKVVIHCSPTALAASGIVNANPIAIAGVVAGAGTKKLNGNWFFVENVDTGAGTFALTGTNGADYGAYTSGGNVTPRSGPCIYGEGASAMSMEPGYMITNGNTLIHLDGSYGAPVRAIYMNGQGETQPSSILRVKVPSSPGSTTLQGLSTDVLSAAQTYGIALFEKEGTGTLNVHGHDMHVHSMPDVPPGGIWQDDTGDQDTIKIVDARYRLPSSSIADREVLSAGFAGFTGEIVTMDTGRRYVYGGPVEKMKAVVTAGTAYTGSTSESGAQATATIPASYIPIGGSARGRIKCVMTGTAGVKTARVKCGGSIVASLTSAAGSLSMVLEWSFENIDNANIMPMPGNMSGSGASTNSLTAITKNMLVAQDITITFLLADAADSIRLLDCDFEIIRPNA